MKTLAAPFQGPLFFFRFLSARYGLAMDGEVFFPRYDAIFGLRGRLGIPVMAGWYAARKSDYEKSA